MAKKLPTDEFSEVTKKGTFVIKDGKLTLTTTHENGKESKSTQTGVVADGKLQITMIEDGKEMEMHYVKSKY